MQSSTSSASMQASSSYLRTTSTRSTTSAPHIKRIMKDMMELNKDPLPGILVAHDEKDITIIHAIIIGSRDTPYEGGYFYFHIRCLTSYPNQPPLVKFMTTDGGKVRFNPNLYHCGKVCLSLIGTWPGPTWSSAQTLSSLLLSIQALILNDMPYYNEPGCEPGTNQEAALRYNEIIRHETIRVAVIGMVKNEHFLSIPKALMEQIKASFLTMFKEYESILTSRCYLIDRPMSDPFGSQRGVFQHDQLLKKLRDLQQKLGQAP